MKSRHPEEPLDVAISRLDAGDPPHPNAGLFGASPALSASKVAIIPVPWDRTASFGKGTSQAISTLVQASHFLDFEDGVYDQAYKAGFCLIEEPEGFQHWEQLEANPATINPVSKQITDSLRQSTKSFMSQGKVVGILGGEHSVPLGAIQAIGETKGDFGILHIDAHMDLRNAYEGYEESHASIMHNVLETVPEVTRLVQVGIRDYCRAEVQYARSQGDRVKTYFDRSLFVARSSGVSWRELASMIVSDLPQNVYISFDIDGLDPTLCPHTGTPVPGGLSFQEALLLIDLVASEGRNVIGFDLCEVAPGANTADDWDCNVGARILYKLCSVAAFTNGYCKRADSQYYAIKGLKN